MVDMRQKIAGISGRDEPGATSRSSSAPSAPNARQQWLSAQRQRVGTQVKEWKRSTLKRVEGHVRAAVQPRAQRLFHDAPLTPLARRALRQVTQRPALPHSRSEAGHTARRTSPPTPARTVSQATPQAPSKAQAPSHAVQSAFNAAAQLLGSTTQHIAVNAQRTTRQFGRQARAVAQNPKGQAALRAIDATAGVAWRGAKAASPLLAQLNPVAFLAAPLAAPLAGALSRTPAGQALARTPLAKAVERLDRRYGGELDPVPMATRAQFLGNVKPQERAAVAATARQIVAQQRLVLGDKATEARHDAGKSLFEGGIDQLRWVATGQRDDMDHLLNKTEHRLDRLQHAVMTGKVSAAEAQRQLAATTKGYYGESVRVQNARVGQYDVGIAALRGVRSASEQVAAMTAGAVAGPVGGVAVASLYRDVNKAAYEWSARAHGVAAPRESLVRHGVDVARGAEKFDVKAGQQVAQSFGQGVLSSIVDVAVGRFSLGRTASLLQGGTFAAGLAGPMQAAAVAQTQAHLLFRAPFAVGQAAVEAVQDTRMTPQQKAAYVSKAALSEVASLPFTYLGAGLGIGLDRGRTLASAARQMAGDAVTGLAERVAHTGVFEGRGMTVPEFVGTLAGAASIGWGNFSQHPHAASASGLDPSGPAVRDITLAPTYRPSPQEIFREISQLDSGAYEYLRKRGIPTTFTPNENLAAFGMRMKLSLEMTHVGSAEIHRRDDGFKPRDKKQVRPPQMWIRRTSEPIKWLDQVEVRPARVPHPSPHEDQLADLLRVNGYEVHQQFRFRDVDNDPETGGNKTFTWHADMLVEKNGSATIVEVDGRHHKDSKFQQEQDRRKEHLTRLLFGLQTARIENSEVGMHETVLQRIESKLREVENPEVALNTDGAIKGHSPWAARRCVCEACRGVAGAESGAR